MSNTEIAKFAGEFAILALIVVRVVRAGGSRTGNITYRTFRFLLTRRPVLLVWGLGTLAAMALFVPLALHKSAEWALAAVPFSAFLGLGLAALLVGPGFAIARMFKTPEDVPLAPGEVVVRTLLANHFLGDEARGGTLRVTNRRLIFRPHRFNVQLSAWSLGLDQVRGVGSEGTNLLLVNPGTEGEQMLVLTNAAREAALLRALVAQPEGERRPPD